MLLPFVRRRRQTKKSEKKREDLLFEETSYRAKQEERRKTGTRGEEGVAAVLRPCVGGNSDKQRGRIIRRAAAAEDLEVSGAAVKRELLEDGKWE